MPKLYRFNEKQIAEIETAIEACKDKKVYLRLKCLKLRAVDKKPLSEIATVTEYNEKYVSQLISKYYNKGITAITSSKYGGNSRKLTKEEEQELLNPFLEKAQNGEIVVVDEIRKAYDERTKESSAHATIYYVLARNGWRKIMPRSKHPKKASDDDIDAYKKNNR